MTKTILVAAGHWLVLGTLFGACAAIEGDEDFDRDEASEAAASAPAATSEAATSAPAAADLELEEPAVQGALFDIATPPTGRLCTGKPGKKRGRSNERVSTGFLESRTFVYYAPPGLDPNTPAPLVIVPHGFTMSGDEMYRMTGYQQLADRENFVAIFPDGGGIFPWNVGRGVNGWGGGVAADHNDQAFVDEMIKFVEADQCLDRAHMFISGFSMGGYFSNEVGCLRSDIAAIGPHSGGSHDLSRCPGKVKPAIIFHGDADWLIYYPNGLETRDRWVKRNGCSTSFDKVKVKNGTCEYYKNCVPGGQVALCHFDGLGHAWAGGSGGLFGDPNYENAAELGWAFFKKYAW